MQWKDFINSLLRHGLTQKQIAAEVGCGQATISDLATGKAREPRGSLALALVQLGARNGVSSDAVIAPTDPTPSEAKEST